MRCGGAGHVRCGGEGYVRCGGEGHVRCGLERMCGVAVRGSYQEGLIRSCSPGGSLLLLYLSFFFF